MVERVEVRVGGAYGALVGDGLDVGELVGSELGVGSGVLLTDSNVGPLYGQDVGISLERAGWRILDIVEVPAGEASKSIEVYTDVVRRLARCGLGRDGVIFALGGGVVGDLGGFVAASYMRGVGFVVLPTSLLAMVDSSVGGKVGIDIPEGKNLLGSFLQPRVVIADTGWLTSLSKRELSCGLAEVVKMGLLCGGEFFEHLGRVGEAVRGDREALRTLILDSIRFKAAVVEEDERESGRRAILNYGHTIGHGLEAAADYSLLHGEAVAAGMAAAAFLSAEKGGRDLATIHRELLTDAGLPYASASADPEAVLAAMRRDKKRSSADAPSEYRFVLLDDVGEPRWGVKVEEQEVRQAIEVATGG